MPLHHASASKVSYCYPPMNSTILAHWIIDQSVGHYYSTLCVLYPGSLHQPFPQPRRGHGMLGDRHGRTNRLKIGTEIRKMGVESRLGKEFHFVRAYRRNSGAQ
jgi:hypothetical protein